MIIKHPAMDRFPHDGYGDLQMYDMIGAQRVMLMNDLPATIDPIVWCLDVPQVMLRKAYLFEAKVGPSKVLVTTFALGMTLMKCRFGAMQTSLYEGHDTTKIWPTTWKSLTK